MSGPPPQPPRKPAPFIWPKEIVCQYISQSAQDLFADLATQDHTNLTYNLTYGEIWIFFSQFLRRYMRDNYPDIREPESIQRRVRMTTRNLFGEIARDRYTAQDYPWMHDPDFQPPDDWEPTNISRQLATARLQHQENQRQYRQELEWYTQDMARYQNQNRLATQNSSMTRQATLQSQIHIMRLQDSTAQAYRESNQQAPLQQTPVDLEAEVDRFLGELEQEILSRDNTKTKTKAKNAES